MDKRLAPGLHIVATPIGNLGDLSARAAETLRNADRILVEDTRVTAKLLAHIGAKVPMMRYDDHSTEAERDRIIETPTLVRRAPLPRMWLIGNLQQADLVTDLLHASGVREVSS